MWHSMGEERRPRYVLIVFFCRHAFYVEEPRLDPVCFVWSSVWSCFYGEEPGPWHVLLDLLYIRVFELQHLTINSTPMIPIPFVMISFHSSWYRSINQWNCYLRSSIRVEPRNLFMIVPTCPGFDCIVGSVVYYVQCSICRGLGV